MMQRRPVVFLIVVALQALSLLGFVGTREAVLRTGQEVVLATVRVDPRDLLGGDYVVLRYEISTLSECCFDVGETVYVSLRQDGDVWRAADAADTPPTSDELPYIRGRVVGSSTGRDRPRGPTIDVEYGIESYFVPEGTGRAIERGAGTPLVVAVVDGWGNAQIKTLLPPNG